MRFTERQREAIETKDKTLIVSAAAGSGKTATLTERIIASIMDEHNPADISRMLIVTFTRAAAGELRSRIAAKLSERLEMNPEDARLQRQALLLPSAHIFTIDSFCNMLLKNHASDIGISESFRLCEETEWLLLASGIMENIIEDCFEGRHPKLCTAEEFAHFSDCIVDANAHTELASRLIDVYTRTGGAQDRFALFKETANDLESDAEFLDSFYGSKIKELSIEFFEHYITVLGTLRDIAAEEGAAAYKKYGTSIEAYLAYARSCRSSLDEGYGAARRAVLAWEPLGIGGGAVSKCEELKAYKNAIKDDFEERRCGIAAYFGYSEDELSALKERLSSFLRIFTGVLEMFDSQITRELRDRRMFTFSDIERYAYTLLCNGDKPTPLAEEIAKDYDYVYIDEYQDVDYIQHRIFECVSRPDNRFMVGDIKQSVYGFRGGEPSIFADMKRSFPPLESAKDSPRASIFMSENFRSDKGVIDFVNGIFDKIFGEIGESIGYVREDRLVCGRGVDNGHRATLLLVENIKGRSAHEVEAECVAREIERILASETLDSGVRVRPEDIAIILRNAKSKDIFYKEALERHGITVNMQNRENFFMTPDALLLVAILNAIDNPRKDTYLAGAMRSAVFGFGTEELVDIRTAFPDELSLYDACLAYSSAHPEYGKLTAMLECLDTLRADSRGVSVDKLLVKIYRETNIEVVCDAKINLTLFYNFARKFEASSFKGLYNFINYIEEIARKNKSIVVGENLSGVSGVSIITAHHSKGLEYPICFLCDAGTAYNERSTEESFVFSSKYGVSTRLPSEHGLVVSENPIRSIICDCTVREEREEAARVLYVALTRARERLYITSMPAAWNSSTKALLASAEIKKLFFDKYEILSQNKFIGLMLPIIIDGDFCDVRTVTVELPDTAPEVQADDENDACAEGVKGDMPDNTHGGAISAERRAYLLNEVRKIKENMSYEYPYRALSSLPAKLAVSELYPRVLDGTDETEVTGAEHAEDDVESEYAKPRFMREGARVSSAERGSATHLFMQFCDFAAAKERGIASELARLVECEFMSRKDADTVFKGELECFLYSSLFDMIQSAAKVYRELRFSLSLPADSLTESSELATLISGEKILVQGVIDCVIVREDGEIILVDYKTDRVPKDRAAAEAMLIERHRNQLYYYTLACQELFGKKPKNVYIYSLPLGDVVSCPLS